MRMPAERKMCELYLTRAAAGQRQSPPDAHWAQSRPGGTGYFGSIRFWRGRGGAPLVGALAFVEHLEGILELRRNRHVELLAGRQPRQEPLVIERNQIVVGSKLAERPLHHRG